MTALSNMYRAIRDLPEAAEVTIGSSPGDVSISLCWFGRRAPGMVVSDAVRRSIAVGVAWRIDIDWWRWSWTRGLLRPRRVIETSSDPVPGIRVGTVIAQPGGQEYMIIGRAASKRSWWRSALLAVGIRLLIIADRPRGES